MKDFECHITLSRPVEFLGTETQWKEAVKLRVESVNWHFSCIEGDPLLGQRAYCYATEHYNDQDTAYQMTQNVARVLESKGMLVVRKKVEHVIYDSRRPL